jgi:hypothetical protein
VGRSVRPSPSLWWGGQVAVDDVLVAVGSSCRAVTGGGDAVCRCGPPAVRGVLSVPMAGVPVSGGVDAVLPGCVEQVAEVLLDQMHTADRYLSVDKRLLRQRLGIRGSFLESSSARLDVVPQFVGPESVPCGLLARLRRQGALAGREVTGVRRRFALDVASVTRTSHAVTSHSAGVAVVAVAAVHAAHATRARMRRRAAAAFAWLRRLQVCSDVR